MSGAKAALKQQFQRKFIFGGCHPS